MTCVDAFVAEAAVQLEDAFKTAHHKTLEIEFRRNAQVLIDVERVVMRDEGFGVGAARNRVEHRRFDFDEAVLFHEAANGAYGLKARSKALAAFFIDDEVGIALAAAGFDVGEALVLVGKRADGLRHQAKLFDAHRELALVGAEKRAFGGNDVAQVEALEKRVGFVADVCRRHEILHFAREVAHGGKGCLAHHALEHHAAGDSHFDGGFIELFARLFSVFGAQIPEEVLAHEVVGVGDAFFAQLGKLGAALGDDVVFVGIGSGCRRLLLFVFAHFLILVVTGQMPILRLASMN